MFCMLVICVFFQAEDGIRDLVRSRGLGDVYKRQLLKSLIESSLRCYTGKRRFQYGECLSGRFVPCEAVSYTHLTLPTSDLV